MIDTYELVNDTNITLFFHLCSMIGFLVHVSVMFLLM